MFEFIKNLLFPKPKIRDIENHLDRADTFYDMHKEALADVKIAVAEHNDHAQSKIDALSTAIAKVQADINHANALHEIASTPVQAA